MGCGGSKEAGPSPKVAIEDRFIAETTIDDTGIEDFDKAFQKADEPLSGIIGMNNQFQTAIEQLMAAASALFGANLPEAQIKDGKLSVEIYKPPQTEKEKKIIIANLTGVRKPKEPKDKGIEIKDAKLYEEMKKNEELLNALMDCNEQIMYFNTFVAKKEFKDVKLIVHCNRAKVDVPKPKDNSKELAKINMVKRAVNNFNHGFFPVKAGLAKAAFKDGLNVVKIVKPMMEKLKEALKGMTPKVDCDPQGLLEGKLDFKISLPDSPDINSFIEKSDAIPPMLKKAWKHIYGEGGMVDCLKECAAKLAEVKPQVDEAIEAIKALPTEPEKIQEAAQKAVTEKKIGMLEAPKIPEKLKKNVEQLSRTPDILKEFMENLKGTLADLIEALGGAAEDAKGEAGGTAGMIAAVDAAKDQVEAVTEAPKEAVKETIEEEPQVEEKPVAVESSGKEAKEEQPTPKNLVGAPALVQVEDEIAPVPVIQETNGSVGNGWCC